MMTPLFSHALTPRPAPQHSVRPKINPATFSFRADIHIQTLDPKTLEAKGIGYAWKKGIRITSRSPLAKPWYVSWLLEEGSNLSILKERVKDSREAKYTLTRRTLHNIAQMYPELAGTVNRIVREDYNPAGRAPVCIPDGWEEERSALEAEIGRELNQYQMLTVILDGRTDYKRLVGGIHSPAKRLSQKERNAIKAKCYKAIGFCFPNLYGVAMAEAAILAPQTVKRHNQQQKAS